MAKKSKLSFKKILPWLIVVLIAIGIQMGLVYLKVYKNNTNQHKGEPFLYIPTGCTFSQLKEILTKDNWVDDINSFEWVAQKMNYIDHVKPGKYRVDRSLNNKDLIALLRSGKQEPVKLTITNVRTVEQLAGLVQKHLEADSAEIVFLLNDKHFLNENGLNEYSALTIIVPNTYEFWWNINAEGFFKRMKQEHDRFWAGTRTEKAKSIGLNSVEVVSLASIVECETKKNDEKPIVAGVYMNRLHKGMRLEADPTLIFALGDYSIRRVLNEHKSVDSPYNTYANTGLPPGPICIPTITSIDAVLNYKQHNYVFFCAREDFSGYHNFASNYAQHMLNARKYHQALNARKILK